jgi:hypothetical protein
MVCSTVDAARSFLIFVGGSPVSPGGWPPGDRLRLVPTKRRTGTRPKRPRCAAGPCWPPDDRSRRVQDLAPCHQRRIHYIVTAEGPMKSQPSRIQNNLKRLGRAPRASQIALYFVVSLFNATEMTLSDRKCSHEYLADLRRNYQATDNSLTTRRVARRQPNETRRSVPERVGAATIPPGSPAITHLSSTDPVRRLDLATVPHEPGIDHPRL